MAGKSSVLTTSQLDRCDTSIKADVRRRSELRQASTRQTSSERIVAHSKAGRQVVVGEEPSPRWRLQRHERRCRTRPRTTCKSTGASGRASAVGHVDTVRLFGEPSQSRAMVRAIVKPLTKGPSRRDQLNTDAGAELVRLRNNNAICRYFSRTERPRSRTEPAWGCQT